MCLDVSNTIYVLKSFLWIILSSQLNISNLNPEASSLWQIETWLQRILLKSLPDISFLFAHPTEASFGAKRRKAWTAL